MKKSKSALMVGIIWTSIILILLTAGTFAAQTVIVVQPSDSNRLTGTVGVSFTYIDGNFDTTLHDVNIDIAFSTTAGAFTTSLVADGNLDTYCGVGVNYTSLQTCTFTFNTTAQTDGNYFIDINITTEIEGGSVDQNSVTDSSDNNFSLDNSVATLTISAPLAGASSAALVDVVLTYSSSESDISKYWVQVDSQTEIDNGTNLSYTFAGLVIGDHLLRVKATDDLDNNSAQATVAISVFGTSGGGTNCGDNTCNGTETAATCPSDCSAVCGDNACTHTESVDNCPVDCGPSQVCGNNVCDNGENFNNCPNDCEAPKGQIIKEIVLNRETKGKPTPDDMRRILEAAGASPNAIEKATEALSKTSIGRNFEVTKSTDDSGNESFTTVVELVVSNTTGKMLRNVKVIEEIPKQAVENASNIATSTVFTVLKSDPIVEFTIDTLDAGETRSIKYRFDDQISDEEIALFSMPFVSDFLEDQPVLTCAELNCDDGNSCTIDSCETNRCLNIPAPDGQSCGIGLVCQQGNCTDATTGEIVEVKEEDSSGLIIGIVVVVIIAIAAYTFYLKK